MVTHDGVRPLLHRPVRKDRIHVGNEQDAATPASGQRGHQVVTDRRCDRVHHVRQVTAAHISGRNCSWNLNGCRPTEEPRNNRWERISRTVASWMQFDVGPAPTESFLRSLSITALQCHAPLPFS